MGERSTYIRASGRIQESQGSYKSPGPWGAYGTHGLHTRARGRIYKPKDAYKSPSALLHLEFDIVWLEMHILEVQIIFKVRM
jgi:hypothetical protein